MWRPAAERILRMLTTWVAPHPADAGRFIVHPVGTGPLWCWHHEDRFGEVTMWSTGKFYSPAQAQRDIRAVRMRAEADVRVRGSAVPISVIRQSGGP